MIGPELSELIEKTNKLRSIAIALLAIAGFATFLLWDINLP